MWNDHANGHLGRIFREHEMRQLEEDHEYNRLSDDEKNLRRIAARQQERMGRAMFPCQHDENTP